MTLRLSIFSVRVAEQVLDSKLALKQEIENILTDGLAGAKISGDGAARLLPRRLLLRDQSAHRLDDMGPRTEQLRVRPELG